MDIYGIDMTDPSNLNHYNELILFQMDQSRKEIVVDSPESALQNTLHTLAHALDLEYEYSRVTKVVRITHPESANLLEAKTTDKVASEPRPVYYIGSDHIRTESPSYNPELEILTDDLPPNWLNASGNIDLAPHDSADLDMAALESYIGPPPPDMYSLGDSRSNTAAFEGQSNAFDSPWDSASHSFPKVQANELPQTIPNPSLSRSTSFSMTDLPDSHQPVDISSFVTDDAPHYPSFTNPGSYLNSTHSPSPSPRNYRMFPIAPPGFWPGRQSSPYGNETPPLLARRASSAASVKSRASSVKSRASSIKSRASSIKSTASSIKSAASSIKSTASSGRQGPLNDIVYSAMKAVKAVGACWTCKVLRKSCSVESPCFMCPKRDHDSNWRAVGCRRGTLKSETLALDLRQLAATSPMIKECPHLLNSDDVPLRKLASGYLDIIITEREECLKSDLVLARQFPAFDEFSESLRSRSVIFKCSRQFDIGKILDLPRVMTALDECILAIIWEILECKPAGALFEKNLEEMVVVLRSAAVYQAEAKSGWLIEQENASNNQLIGQSLICLRTCLEALRLKDGGILPGIPHPKGTSLAIVIEGISNINLHLDRYLDELSRVLFLRTNLLHKSYWLSIFYSLCIHHYVRQIIIELAKSISDTFDESRVPYCFREYLYLVVRLFIAASSSYDPLIEDYTCHTPSPRSDDIIKHYLVAQNAVGQETWHSKGIKSSGDYLLQIYGVTGGKIHSESSCSTEAAELDHTTAQSFPRTCPTSNDGIPSPQIGGFQCSFPGCTAQLFQTQYLLKSHSNVHSLDRPYYCPVENCPRGKAGVGFKRSNELIRHGRIHESYCYVCPFCPNREKKFPRRDNLIRHVRVFHADKDKDDPELVAAIAQGNKTRWMPGKQRQ